VLLRFTASSQITFLLPGDISHGLHTRSLRPMNACDGDNPTDGVDADKWHRRHAGFAGNLFMDGFFARHIAFVCSATLQ